MTQIKNNFIAINVAFVVLVVEKTLYIAIIVEYVWIKQSLEHIIVDQKVEKMYAQFVLKVFIHHLVQCLSLNVGI